MVPPYDCSAPEVLPPYDSVDTTAAPCFLICHQYKPELIRGFSLVSIAQNSAVPGLHLFLKLVSFLCPCGCVVQFPLDLYQIESYSSSRFISFLITQLDLEESFSENSSNSHQMCLVQFAPLMKRFDSQCCGVCISCQLFVCFVEVEDSFHSSS